MYVIRFSLLFLYLFLYFIVFECALFNCYFFLSSKYISISICTSVCSSALFGVVLCLRFCLDFRSLVYPTRFVLDRPLTISLNMEHTHAHTYDTTRKLQKQRNEVILFHLFDCIFTRFHFTFSIFTSYSHLLATCYLLACSFPALLQL